MKPRTVILTLELQDCDVPLSVLRRTRHVLGYRSPAPPTDNYDELAEWGEDVAQATATVAQPSTTRGGKGRRR